MNSSQGLTAGERAPNVRAPLVDPDGTVVETELSTLYADRPVLLVFYTNDFTPDCIEEWCSFREYDWFTSDGAVRVVGVSGSRVSTHRRFIGHLNLSFPLYSDTNLAIAEGFGVVYRVFGLLERSRRSCFLVDTDGTIRYRWLSEHRIDPTFGGPPVAEIHEAIVEELETLDVETFGFGQ
ncbi:MAG: redoxin domain-containing protein [Halalkalicoccus sp.]